MMTINKTLLALLLCLSVVPLSAQTAPHAKLDFVRIENFDEWIGQDISYKWLDLVRLVFPEFDPATRTASRSVEFRTLSPGLINPQIGRPMKIEALKIVWFMSKGREYLAAIIEIRPPDGRGMSLFPLAVFTFSPGPVLIDIVPGRLTDGEDETVAFASVFSEIDFGKGKNRRETFSLVNKQTLAGVGTSETNRFFLLDDGRLREIYRSPGLVSTENCPEIVKKEFYSTYVYARPNDRGVYKIGLVTTRDRNKKCPDLKYFFAVQTNEIYRLIWDAKEKVFRPKLLSIDSMPLGNAWGETPEEDLEFDGTLKTGISYKAEAFLDPKKGLRLARPLKTEPREIVRLEWEDPWEILSGKNFTRANPQTLSFWVTLRETKVLPDGRRRTLYICMVDSFGNHGRFNH